MPTHATIPPDEPPKSPKKPRDADFERTISEIESSVTLERDAEHDRSVFALAREFYRDMTKDRVQEGAKQSFIGHFMNARLGARYPLAQVWRDDDWDDDD